MEQSLAPLHKFPKINASDPIVAQFAAAVDEYLAPWRPIEGITDGMARGRGLISPRILKAISHAPQVRCRTLAPTLRPCTLALYTGPTLRPCTLALPSDRAHWPCTLVLHTGPAHLSCTLALPSGRAH